MSYKESIDKIINITYDRIFKPTPSEDSIKPKKSVDNKKCSSCLFYNKGSEYCGYLFSYHEPDDYCGNHLLKMNNFKKY
jgi:hypothetical protein